MVGIGLIILLAVSMLAAPVLAMGASSADIALDPTSVEVESGEAFTVTLRIAAIPEPGMAAYDFRITFTPGVIEFATSEHDHEWPDNDYGSPLVFNVDNAAGHISFNDINLAIPAPSGDITLAVLHGTATSTESVSTDLRFDKADIVDPDGEDITAIVTYGEIRVWVTEAVQHPVVGNADPVSRLARLAPWIAMMTAIIAGVTLFLRRRRATA